MRRWIEKITKIPLSLQRIVKENIVKKKNYFFFHNNRTKVKNWFSNYLIYSSLFLDLFEILIRKLKLTYLFFRWSSKTIFHDGVVLFNPVVSRDRGIANRRCEIYLNDYQKLFNDTISLSPDDIVIDIGAHIGSFSIPLVKKYNVQVLAYEPDLQNFYCIQKGIKENRIFQEKLIIERSVIWTTEGMVEFSQGATSSTGSVVKTKFFLQQRGSHSLMIPSTTLSAIFKKQNIEKCKILKMDCEGSEHFIFEHLSADVIDKIEHIFLEVHPLPDHPSEVFIERLGKHFELKYFRKEIKKGGLSSHIYEVFGRKIPVSARTANR